jgi:predicted DNA binding CopG/RHH family protein
MAQKKLSSVNTRLPDDLLARLRKHIDENGLKSQTVFAEAIRLYLTKRKENRK